MSGDSSMATDDREGRNREYREFAESLRNLEIDRILGSSAEKHGKDAFDALWGLALSGGGIRSATYCLGVLQALAKRGLLGAFHYCSTVSGGGYIGGYLQAMLHRHGLDDTLQNLMPATGGQHEEDAKETVGTSYAKSSAISDSILKLRSYSNFLSPNKRPLSGDRIAIVATYVSNMLLTQIQLGALILALVLLPFLLVWVLQALGKTPLLVWFMAMTATVIALLLRPRKKISKHREDNPESTPQRLFKGSSLIPPIGLATSFLLLSCLVWPLAEVGQQFVPGGGHDFMQWLAMVTGVDYKPERERELFAAVAISSTYLLGFLTWLLWWWREASKRPQFGTRLGKQLLFGFAACVAMGFAADRLSGLPILDDSHRRLVALMEREGAGKPNRGIDITVKLDQLTANTSIQPSSTGMRRNADPAASNALASHHLWLKPYLTLALGVPLLFATFFAINLLHHSLSYMEGDAVSRERWTRLMGRTSLWVLGGTALTLSLTVFIPAYLKFGPIDQAEHRSYWISVLLAGWATISGAGVAVGYWEQASRIARGFGASLKKILLAMALWVFIGGIVVLAGIFVLNFLDFNHETDTAENVGLVLIGCMSLTLGIWLLLARFIDDNEFSMNGFYRNRLVRCYLAASRSDHASRDAETGLDPEKDDIKLRVLREFQYQKHSDEKETLRPLYPLLCGAVNLVRSRRLEWQDRKAASFVFSPLFCGHQPLPDGQTGPIGDRLELPNTTRPLSSLNKSEIASDHTLGAAMSVSGAAVSSSMGYHSSPAVSALLTLFNARLGWWVVNENAEDKVIYFTGLNLLSELVSNTHENGKFAYVTDGGHFENLGIYELVRRRCRFILSVDATADHQRGFGDLANAVHKCRVDFGAEIDIDTSLMQKKSETTGFISRCAALGKITYRDGEQGFLLYVKPSLLGDESADIRNYAGLHPMFPHEPTSDQFFDEIQFECYRQLGFQNMLSIIEPVEVHSNGDAPDPTEQSLDQNRGPQSAPADRTASGTDAESPVGPARTHGVRVGLLDQATKERFVKRLKYRLYEPSDATAVSRTHHGDALGKLLQELRENHALKSLDLQLYPGMIKYDPKQGDPSTPLKMDLPKDEHFRDCFYFVQEIIQLMEGVYNDLELDRNWNHPDNRGWMNLFLHWSWVPMFRLVWALTLQTRGSRFVHFCERRLEMPRLDDFLQVDWVKIIPSHAMRSRRHAARSEQKAMRSRRALLRLHSCEQYRLGNINFLEKNLLCSPTVMNRVGGTQGFKWGILKFSMEKFLKKGTAIRHKAPELPVGVVLLTLGSTQTKRPTWTISILRVHDHLRRMGLGLAFVREVLARTIGDGQDLLENADIVSGDCGTVLGTVTALTAAKHNKRLRRFLVHARLTRASEKPQSTTP